MGLRGVYMCVKKDMGKHISCYMPTVKHGEEERGKTQLMTRHDNQGNTALLQRCSTSFSAE